MNIQELASQFLTFTNAGVMLAAWSIIQAIDRGLPSMSAKAFMVRMKPGAAMALCAAMCCIPGVQGADLSLANKVILGLVLGSFAGTAHKVVTQTILGQDRRLPGRPIGIKGPPPLEDATK